MDIGPFFVKPGWSNIVFPWFNIQVYVFVVLVEEEAYAKVEAQKEEDEG